MTLMYSSLFLLSLAVIFSLLSYLKLQRFRNQNESHNFDVDATLPIRGLLAILIVCHHIGQRFADTPIGLFTAFGTTVVSAFFFISGYGLMVSYQKKGKAYLSNFFKHRLSKLLPVFLTLTIVLSAYISIFHHHPIADIAKALLLRGITPLPNSWFMYAIIFQYIAFYIACKIGKTKIQCIIIATLLTMVSIAGLHAMGFGSYWWTSQPAFILGVIVAAYENYLRQLLSKHTLVTILAVFLMMMLGRYNIRFKLIPESIALFLFPNLMSLLVLFMIYAYGAIHNRGVRFLGKISLEIYLIQGIAIMFMSRFNVPWYAFTICALAITIPVASIANKFSKMISSRF